MKATDNSDKNSARQVNEAQNTTNQGEFLEIICLFCGFCVGKYQSKAYM